jgi:hypothetical protein
MRKLFVIAVLITCSAPFTNAQSTDDYNKYDVFAGYSHNRVDFGDSSDDFDAREGFNGLNVSATGNLTRYVGLKGDYSFHRKSFDEGLFSVDADLHQIFGGVQVKDNSKETSVKPFAHLMAGIAHAKISASGVGSDNESGFAGVIGGGVDIRVNDRVDFRVIQFDYNPTRLGGDSTQHNFRIGVGIVFR